MKTPKDITFSHLPFVPVVGQVIYVEPRHDAALNDFIRSHYDWLLDVFLEHGLHFCYLPLLMEQTLRYNAPYLKRKSMNEEAPSIYGYAEEGAIDRPMLVFAADGVEAGAEHTFTLKAVPLDKGLLSTRKRMFRKLAEKVWQMTDYKSLHQEEESRKRNEILIKKVVCELQTKLLEKEQEFAAETMRLVDEANMRQLFAKKYNESLGIRENFPDDGNFYLVELEYPEIKQPKREPPQKEPEPPRKDSGNSEGVKFSLRRRPEREIPKEYLSKPKVRLYRGKKPETISKERESLREELFRPEKAEIVDALFDSESRKIAEELLQRVDALRNRGVNTMLIHQLIDAHERLSRIRITKDFRIILTDYDNMEIEMTMLPKAVFLLFLRHPEGIRFKELSEHYSELYDIYRRMQPIGTTEKQKQSVRDVTDPCKNSINEKCAQIRKAFVTAFDEHLASHYFVTGKRGEPKGIQLPRELVKWEK